MLYSLTPFHKQPSRLHMTLWNRAKY